MFNLTQTTKTTNVPTIDKSAAYYAAVTRFEQYMQVPNKQLKAELLAIYSEGDAWRVLNAGKTYWQRYMQSVIDHGCHDNKLEFMLRAAQVKYNAFEKRFALMATVLRSRHPVPAFYTARVAPQQGAYELVMPSNTMNPADYWEQQEEGYELEARTVVIDAKLPSQEHNMITPEEVILWVADQEGFGGLDFVTTCAMRHIWRTQAAGIGEALASAITPEQQEMLDRVPTVEEMKGKHLVRLEILKGTRTHSHPLAVLGAAAWAKKTVARDLYNSMVFGQRAVEFVKGLLDKAPALADVNRGEFFEDVNGAIYADNGYHGNYDLYANWEDKDLMTLGGHETLMPLRAWGEKLKGFSARELHDILSSLENTLAIITKDGINTCAELDAQFHGMTEKMGWPCLPMIWMVDDEGNSSQVFDPDEAAAQWQESQAEFKARSVADRIDALRI